MSHILGWTMHADVGSPFDRSELNAFRDLWLAKAKLAGGLPARADFDADALKPFLPHVSIVERATHPNGRPSYLYRFFGSALVHEFGEQTGQFLEMSMPQDRLNRWITGYNTVLEAGAPMRLLSYFEIPRVFFLNGESFTAPLSKNGRKPDTILACTYFTPAATAEAQSA